MKLRKLERPVSLERAYTIISAPHVTEKATLLTQDGSYVFRTSIDATKPEIKSAIEQIFKVKVESVNTLVAKGKTKRFRGRPGQRSDFKKAIVRLAQGQTIDLGAGV